MIIALIIGFGVCGWGIWWIAKDLRELLDKYI